MSYATAHRTLALAIFLAVIPAAAQTTAPEASVSTPPAVTAAPTFSQSPQQSFPRVSGLADKAVEALVNKQLATRERADRTTRTNCLNAFVSHGKPTYSELVRLAYLSPRLLSVDVRVSDYCGGPYPNANTPYPLTFDLATGRELDWHRFFIDSFLNPPADRPSALLALYLSHAALDEDCSSAVNDRSTTFDFWFDSAHKAVIAHPNSLPHAAESCAKLVPLPFAEIAPYVLSPAHRQDLLTPPAASK